MFARTDSDDLLDVGHPDLAVTDFPGACSLCDEVKDVVDAAVINNEFHLGLGHEVDLVFTAAVSLGVATLATEASYFRDGHPLYASAFEGFLHVVDLEGLHDCGYELHSFILPYLEKW